MIEIRKTSISELEESGAMPDLLRSYGAESASPEFGEVNASFDTYRMLEQAGGLHVIGAFGPELVGLASLLVYGLPHYGGACVCAMESFFVKPDHRMGGAGIKLLRAAEAHAVSLGAKALMVSAPTGGRLEQIMPRLCYRAASTIFVRRLA